MERGINSPSFKIEEYFTKGKNKDELNEDLGVITNYYAAIIDGSTSKSEFRWDGKTTGKIASEIIGNEIQKLPDDIDAYEAIERISRGIYSFYDKHGLLNQVSNNPELKISASAVIFSAIRNEVWQIGDCPCLIGNSYFPNTKKIDRIMSEARSAFLETEIARGITVSELMQHDSGREFIIPFLSQQNYLQNNPLAEEYYSYAVLDGFPIDAEQVKIYPVKQEKTIILASDGYPKLLSSLEETENYLKRILATDPLCFREYKSTKGLKTGNNSFDDRTYLRIARLL